MSLSDVPTSSAVTYRPPRLSTVSPKSSSASRRRSGSSGAAPGGMAMTPFPPPSGRSATADFAVIARDRHSASRTATRVSA
jgi:hypothetical protein